MDDAWHASTSLSSGTGAETYAESREPTSLSSGTGAKVDAQDNLCVCLGQRLPTLLESKSSWNALTSQFGDKIMAIPHLPKRRMEANSRETPLGPIVGNFDGKELTVFDNEDQVP